MPLSEQFMDNPHADRVRRVASLRQASVRSREGRFLIEGPQAVREAVTCMPGCVTDVYIDPSAGSNDDIIEASLNARNPVYVHRVSTKVLKRISPNAQSVAAVGRSKPFERNLADFSLPQAISGTPAPLLAACWQVRDPGNEGTLIRTADAAGLDAIILVDDCVHPLNPKVVRATAGSLFHIPVLQAGTDEFFAWASENTTDVWAADIHGTPNQAPYDLSTLVFARNGEEGKGQVSGRTRPLALLFGNEARGLPTSIVAQATASVMIPIYGKAESLNLAMSGAVLMYTLAMVGHNS